MFTGIIEAVGHIQAIDYKGSDICLTINVGTLDLSDVKVGDSIATNGVCLTVVQMTDSTYSADLSLETLQCSSLNKMPIGSPVNLEKALQVNARLGGHIVSGHVDGLGEVISIANLGRAIEYWIQVPKDIAKYVAQKGSVTIDGVSLTVNNVQKNRFKITIIPHTIDQTIIHTYKVGTKVNIEVDVIARYLERLVCGQEEHPSSTPSQEGISMDFLAKSGFLK